MIQKKREVEWFTITPDLETEPESVGTFPVQTNALGDWLCPKCGKVAEAWEGVIDQDYMGNDIRGWSYDCYTCGIGSEPQEHGDDYR